MTMQRIGVSMLAVFVLGFAAGQVFDRDSTANAQSRKVYELRTYTAPEGKLQNLTDTFRDHTIGLFTKLGMENVGYFVPADAPASGNTLIYILAHDSREAAKKSWDAFRTDPEWLRIRAASEADGSLATDVKSVFMNPLDFSAMQ